MEFDLGNILYIVITLIAVIAGLAGRKKKPASGSGEGSKGSAPGFMDNLENLLKMGQEDPEVTTLRDDEEDLLPEVDPDTEMADLQPVMENVPEQPVYMDEYAQVLRRLESREMQDPLSESQEADNEPLEVIDLDHEEGTDYFDIVRDFDAQTAVIYAAIINRVDYS